MSIFVKICGITNEKDAYSAIKYGADAIGLNQFVKSPRYVDESELLKIKRVLSKEITVVPVFVNPKDEEVYNFLQIFPNSTLQFHGAETRSFCEKFNKPYIKSMTNRREQLLLHHCGGQLNWTLLTVLCKLLENF